MAISEMEDSRGLSSWSARSIARWAHKSMLKAKVERWFADSMGMTVVEWRSAQADVRDGVAPDITRGHDYPVVPKARNDQ